ncbi:hypothetical protein [Candidatus Steffania adelgidicola]|uniref:hypothetical protein n=1 Tax=Candidatus Steffania adelgidicola TaxID=1076626 RepID=UPI001D00534B|nr:hypothetical protein [Candidatus Steffania adelgidicola]
MQHTLEGISAYYTVLCDTEKDFAKIHQFHQETQAAQDSSNLDAETSAFMHDQIAITDTTHNAILLYLLHYMASMLENIYVKILNRLTRAEKC